MVKKICLVLLMSMAGLVASAAQFYINVKTGNDANTGAQQSPLKTIEEAAKRTNASTKKEVTTIFIAEGIYYITQTALFNNDKFTAQNRLTIRAEVMPDDAGWMPQSMPIIVIAVAGKPTPADGELLTGLQIEVSHVTIEGLRLTGSPVYYHFDVKQDRRPYPIFRTGKNLDDLLITQCLFTGNTDVMPVRVAVVANGSGVVLDHCVFFNCENAAVFGDAESGNSRGNAMRYCLLYGNNYGGFWTSPSVTDDFEFHHNIIANSPVAWINDKSDRHYLAHDCIFAGDAVIAKSGSENGTKVADVSFLKTSNVQVSVTIEIEKDQHKNNYLQLKEGSFGAELKAGLFKK